MKSDSSNLMYRLYGYGEDPKLDVIIEEKGSQFVALRKVQWCKSEDTPKDDYKAHFEIRRWIVRNDGDVTPGKGCVFLTEDGPDNCVSELVDYGFGKTKDILLKLKNRDDFKEAVEHMYDEEDLGDGEYFDARELLLSE